VAYAFLHLLPRSPRATRRWPTPLIDLGTFLAHSMVIGAGVRVVVARPSDRQQPGGTMAFQITEVQKALKGVDYPASKDELASHAEGNGADRELVEALRGMSKNSFDGPNAVMKELKGSLTGSND
jgi:hypothetical protein